MKERFLIKNYTPDDCNKIAWKAIEYARNKIKKSNTVTLLNEGDRILISNQVMVMRKKAREKMNFKDFVLAYLDIDDLQTKKIRKKKKSIKFHNVGNCGEFGLLALYYCQKNNCPAKVVSYLDDEGDHTFVLINHFGDINDPDTWNETTFVCDPLTNQVYPANEAENKLPYYKELLQKEEGHPKFKVLYEVDNENIEDAKQKYNRVMKKIDFIFDLVLFLNINENIQININDMITEFKKYYCDPEKFAQQSGYYIERAFHKFTKVVTNELFDAYDTPAEAENDISDALVKLDLIKKENLSFIEQLIIDGDSSYRDKIIQKHFIKDNKNNLYKFISHTNSNENRFLNLFYHDIRMERLDFIFKMVGCNRFFELLLSTNKFGLSLIELQANDERTAFFLKIGKMIIKHRHEIDENLMIEFVKNLFLALNNQFISNTKLFYIIIEILITTELPEIEMDITSLLNRKNELNHNVLQIFILNNDQRLEKILKFLPLNHLLFLMCNKDYYKKSALVNAIENHNYLFFEQLILKIDNEKNNELKKCCCEEIKTMLLDNNRHYHLKSPLILAINSKDRDLAKTILLLMQVANIKSIINCHIYREHVFYEESLQTPLRLAISNQDIAMVALLLKYGADPREEPLDGSDQDYINQLAMQDPTNENYRMIKILIDNNVQNKINVIMPNNPNRLFNPKSPNESIEYLKNKK